MDRLLFGTAGSPISSRVRTRAAGLDRLVELGLDGMELEFVRGVRMAEDPEAVREQAQRLGLTLTAHGPYYINLFSLDPAKTSASVERVLATARTAHTCGAFSCTFHAAFYQGRPADVVYAAVRDRLKGIVRVLQDEGNPIWVRPETTGKPSQFAGLEELLSLSAEIEQVRPTIDWSHLHARSGGKVNTSEEFRTVLDRVEDVLGKEGLQDMHMHVAGIEYTDKGERRHLDLVDSDLCWRELLSVMKEYNVTGMLICESPSIEGDALKLRDAFRTL
ncbi:MAG: TIM barrel protein [Candidatus Undinarchaeales archaeon]|jgi:deoxyribonuclease-4|nr:TIM barrel protein [Candidatus Undinarchaeales archaeon]MDP7491518.1 TIM barrel protein [Candidatus Undinarchaeales archaeon]